MTLLNKAIPSLNIAAQCFIRLSLISLAFSACEVDSIKPSGLAGGEPTSLDRGFYIPPELDMAPDQPPLDQLDGAIGAEEGVYGAPCEGPEDCASGLCVRLGEGYVCTRACTVGCEPFADGQAAFCRYDPSQNAEQFVCYPSQNRLCQTCLTEAQCDGAP